MIRFRQKAVAPRTFRPSGRSGSPAPLLRRLVALALLVIAMPAPAQTPDTFTRDDLKRVEAARDAAQKRLAQIQRRGDAASREAADIDADLLAAANDSRRREESAAATEIRLAQLEREVARARAQLAADQAGLEDLLAALMTMNARRPPAFAASPEEAGKAVRAAILMGEAAPLLQARADGLKTKIRTINDGMAAAARERGQLEAEETMLSARRAEIEALAEEKRIARTSIATETASLEAETRRLALQADTLHALLDGLAKTAPTAPGRKPSSGSKPVPGSKPAAVATLPVSGTGAAPRPAPASSRPLLPAVGRNVRKFGELVAGEPSAGLTVATRSGAQIIAPLDARVEYAGVFRSYGQMLILDVGNDILVIVSGLDALYPEAGQWVLAGEPIGRMADQKSPSPELYLEVRRQGQPVDPERWLGRGA